MSCVCVCVPLCSGVTCETATRADPTGCNGGENYCWRGACVCDAGHEGVECATRKCSAACVAPGGSCDGGSCVCTPNFYGDSCQSRFCEGVTVRTERAGSISDSPDTRQYANGAHCVWIVRPAGVVGEYGIRLRLRKFLTEVAVDRLEVWDGDLRDETANGTNAAASLRLLAVLSGAPNLTESVFYAFDTGVMSLRFITDDETVEYGFDADYDVLQCATPCANGGRCVEPTSTTAPCRCERGYAGPTVRPGVGVCVCVYVYCQVVASHALQYCVS